MATIPCYLEALGVFAFQSRETTLKDVSQGCEMGISYTENGKVLLCRSHLTILSHIYEDLFLSDQTLSRESLQ